MHLLRPRAKVTTVGTTAKGLVKQREHWSGEVDAKVMTPTIQVRRPAPSWRAYLQLFELEDSVRQMREARLTADPVQIAAAEYRWRQAREPFEKVAYGRV